MAKGIGLVAFLLALEGAFLFHVSSPANLPSAARRHAPSVVARRAVPAAAAAAPVDAPDGGEADGFHAKPCTPTNRC